MSLQHFGNNLINKISRLTQNENVYHTKIIILLTSFTMNNRVLHTQKVSSRIVKLFLCVKLLQAPIVL